MLWKYGNRAINILLKYCRGIILIGNKALGCPGLGNLYDFKCSMRLNNYNEMEQKE